jgi:hypothetical protein
MFGVKSVVAALTVATMIGSSAFAAPLAPGKPAGVEKAQVAGIGTGTILIGAAVIGVIAAIAITVNNQSSNNPATGALGGPNSGGVTPATNP